MPNKDSKCSCCLCGEPLAHSKYYKSNSEFYKDGHLPICKACFSRKFGNYAAEYGSNKIAMKRMCMAFDIYFNEALFDKCDKDDGTVLGNYFRMLNMSQNKEKTFDTTIAEGFDWSGENKKPVKETRKQIIENEDDESEIPQKYIEKWGGGLNLQDYETLDSHYKYLKTANPNCDSNQEIFIIDLCYIKMQQMNAVRSGEVDNYNKLTESYRKSFTQAGLKTKQDEIKTSDDCWSTFCNIVSEYTPEEYYRDKSRYRDFDGLGDYYERMAVRPLKNIVMGTQNRDDEYFVHEVNEDE